MNMAVCNVCGTEVQEGVTSCPNCGSPIAGAVAAKVVEPVAAAVEQTTAQAVPAAQGITFASTGLNSLNGEIEAKSDKKIDAIVAKIEGKDFSGAYEAADIEDNKLFAILAYFPLLCLIPLFAAKTSKYAKFHTNQGLVLFIVEIGLTVISVIFGFIPVVKGLLAPICTAVTVVFSITMFLYGLMNAVQDRAKELPVIGGLRIIK